jgi:hypothetical protein
MKKILSIYIGLAKIMYINIAKKSLHPTATVTSKFGEHYSSTMHKKIQSGSSSSLRIVKINKETIF